MHLASWPSLGQRSSDIHFPHLSFTLLGAKLSAAEEEDKGNCHFSNGRLVEAKQAPKEVSLVEMSRPGINGGR